MIDRGLDGVKVLEFIRERENIVLLMGNHEKMCLNALREDSHPRTRKHWKLNGGGPTRVDLAEHPTRDALLAYLSNAP